MSQANIASKYYRQISQVNTTGKYHRQIKGIQGIKGNHNNLITYFCKEHCHRALFKKQCRNDCTIRISIFTDDINTVVMPNMIGAIQTKCVHKLLSIFKCLIWYCYDKWPFIMKIRFWGVRVKCIISGNTWKQATPQLRLLKPHLSWGCLGIDHNDNCLFLTVRSR